MKMFKNFFLKKKLMKVLGQYVEFCEYEEYCEILVTKARTKEQRDLAKLRLAAVQYQVKKLHEVVYFYKLELQGLQSKVGEVTC